jgi:hypothetical protein
MPKHVALQLHGVRLGLLECSAPLFRRKVRFFRSCNSHPWGLHKCRATTSTSKIAELQNEESHANTWRVATPWECSSGALHSPAESATPSELRCTSVELHYMDPKDCRAAERGITCRENSMGVVECSAPLFRRKVRLRLRGRVCTSVKPHYMPSKIAGLQSLGL